MRFARIAAAAAGAVFVLHAAAPALAQERPNVNGTPTYGTVTLVSGFEPDPHAVEVQSGGPLRASVLGTGCVGYVASAPDINLEWTAGTNRLPLLIGAQAREDVTLVVNAPDGRWFCDDDHGGNSAASIRFNNPASGQYNIWVGTFANTSNHPATVRISEIPPRLTPDATPNYSPISLASGFKPDPRRIGLQAGGAVSAASAISGCEGFVSDAPDVRLQWQSSYNNLPLIFFVNSEADTTLVVMAPDGRYYCDDDARDGRDPVVRFNRPSSGVYRVWVGTYDSGAYHDATLSISEMVDR